MDDPTIVRSVAEVLGGIDGWVWSPDEAPALAPDEVLVVYGPLPASPDRVVGVRLYATDDDRRTHARGRRVQLRFRGARGVVDDADRLASIAFAALEGLSRHRGLLDVTRGPIADLGSDANGRAERSDNYTLALDNEEAYRP